MKVVKPTTMATKDIIASNMHVEHGQKLVDVNRELLVNEGSNGNQKEGEENSKPLVDTNYGLLRESEFHYRKRKAMVEDDRNLNGNFK
jgi:hypothetical protein